MQVSRKEGKVIHRALKHWRERELISAEEQHKLSESYQVVLFDWRRLAKYSFWLAIACLLISLFAAMADKWLMDLLQKLFMVPDSIKCLFFAAVSGGLYVAGFLRKQRAPEKVYSNEAIFFLGVIATALMIAFFGKVIDTGSGHFSLLLLLAAIIYGILGLWFPSKLVWVFSLLSLGSWFGAETGYLSGWGTYYFGMNYPLRFVLFSLVLLVFGQVLFTRWEARGDFLRPTRALGLLYLFMALWILSIFGNYGDSTTWLRAKQIELFHWSIIFAAAAIGAIYHGLKFDDGMTKGFGLTFIFINLYTRFFEYFWSSTHKALFFALLAVSFWYLGSRAEKIWHLSLVKPLAKQGARTE